MPSTPDRLAPHDERPDAAGAVAPSRRLRWREWLTVIEYVVARLSDDLIDQWPRGDGHPVVVIPGFLAGPASTRVLRRTLRPPGIPAARLGPWLQPRLRVTN